LRGYKAAGINIWAPAMAALLDLDDDGRIVPSRAARSARAAGLELVTWTLERSGNLAAANNGFYYRTIDSAVTREGDVLRVLDVLARDVGVRGVFSDWPATVSFYAGCAGLP
jgi:glycerophosphoryl diester phosphodiesterase